MPNLARWCGVSLVTICLLALADAPGRAVIFDECGYPVDLEQWDPTAAFVSPRCRLIPPPFRVLDYRFSDSRDLSALDNRGAQPGITGSLPAGRVSRAEPPAGSQTNLSLPQAADSVRDPPLVSNRDDPNGFFDRLRRTPMDAGTTPTARVAD